MIFTSVISGGGFTLGTYAAQDYDLSEAEKYYTKLAYDMNEKILKDINKVLDPKNKDNEEENENISNKRN